VLEAAPAIAEVGAGLQITPNGAAVLKALGLWPALAAQAVPAAAVDLVAGASGRRLLRLDLARLAPGRDWVFVHRADLIDVLAAGARAAGVRLVTGARVTAVAAEGPRLTVNGAPHPAAFVLGADGLHSLVRQALNGGVAPYWTMQAAWRAVIAAEPEAPPAAEVHLGPGRHLVSYPLRGGSLRNIVAVEERRAWTAEGWSQADDPAALRAAFAGFSPRVRGWLARVGEVGLWGLYRHPVARRWQGPGLAILGDAAHPTLPFLAQGANLALEDAWTFAAAFAAGDLPGWEAARRPRALRAVAAADGHARAYHLRRPWSDAAHLALRLAGAVAPGAMLRRFDWLHGLDVTRDG
jgi:salicylate hydroxylase